MKIEYLALFGILLLVPAMPTGTIDDLLGKFQQNDYELEFERVELARYNKNYYRYFRITTFKHNRTCPATNLTYDQKSNLVNVDIVVQVYRFASNEYRIFPIRFEVSYCSVIQKNTMGAGELLKCGNFSGCPLNKGKVFICNWRPDPTRFPPLIPDGRYKVEIQGLHTSTEIFDIHYYGIVSRPMVYKATRII